MQKIFNIRLVSIQQTVWHLSQWLLNEKHIFFFLLEMCVFVFVLLIVISQKGNVSTAQFGEGSYDTIGEFIIWIDRKNSIKLRSKAACLHYYDHGTWRQRN